MEIKPIISVVMAAYNVEKYLPDCIESLLHQTLQEWELIIVDDCSTDKSYIVALDYAKSDARIRVFRNIANMGVARTLNYGVSLANTSLISRMDPDDICLPHRLGYQFSFFEQNPNIGLMSGWATHIDENGKELFTPECPSNLLSAHDIRSQLKKANQLVSPATMFRKDIFDLVGGYRPEFRIAEDYDLWLRMAQYTDVVCTDNVVVYYRRGETSVTIRNPAITSAYTILAQNCNKIRETEGDDGVYLKKFAEKYSIMSEDDAIKLLDANELIVIARDLMKRKFPELAKKYAWRGVLRVSQISIFRLVVGFTVLFGVYNRIAQVYNGLYRIVRRSSQ